MFLSGFKPLILTASSRMNLTLLEGSRLSVFAVGGGGAADDSYAGSSGFFTLLSDYISQTQSMVLDIEIGSGGIGYGRDGQTTTVRGLPSVVSAQGGGGKRGPGWSGVNGEEGGYNGQYGNNEPLPNLCHVKLTPGTPGSGQGDGKGAGGIVVDDRKPTRRSTVDGEGYGAGGGEDNRSGYPGVVVLTLCDS